MTSHPLDTAALALLQALARSDNDPGVRARQAVDAAVRRLHAMIARRVRGLIQRHGLTDLQDDAEQACLIALVDAAQRWDPVRSRFATWLGWHLRGVLVGLRRQWLGDHRTVSGRARATTQSLNTPIDALMHAGSPSDWLIDPAAETETARGAADWLALRCADRLAAGCNAAARAQWIAQLADASDHRAPPLPPRARVRTH